MARVTLAGAAATSCHGKKPHVAELGFLFPRSVSEAFAATEPSPPSTEPTSMCYLISPAFLSFGHPAAPLLPQLPCALR